MKKSIKKDIINEIGRTYQYSEMKMLAEKIEELERELYQLGETCLFFQKKARYARRDFNKMKKTASRALNALAIMTIERVERDAE